MSENKTDLYLKNKLKNLIKELKYIKSVDEIQFSNFTIENEQITDEINSYNELYLRKKNLQLSLNIFHNREIYKKFSVKDISTMRSLKNYENEGEWICTKHIEMKDLEEPLFDYVYCFLSMKKRNKGYVRKCSMCSTDILQEDRKCKNCDTVIQNMDINSNKKEKEVKENKNEFYNDKIVNLSKKDNKIIEHIDHSQNTSTEYIDKPEKYSEHRPKKKGVEYNEFSGKWMCVRCDSYHECSVDMCGICDGKYEDGRWFCDECGKWNSGKKTHCENCERENKYFKNKQMQLLNLNIDPGSDGRVKEDIFMEHIDKWKCGKCGCLNEYSYINCVACGGMYEEGKWMCGGCKEENLCINDKCGGCKNKNMKWRDNEEVGINQNEILKEEEMSLKSLDKVEDQVKKEINLGGGYQDKWKCGVCGYLSEYSFGNCVVCGGMYGDGKWMCGGCKEENNCAKEICGKCENKNVNICGGKERGEKISKLICNKCGSMKTPGDSHRDGCNMEDERDEIHTRKDQWKCENCTMINKWEDERCEVCGLFNDNSPKKYCDSCTKNRVTKNEVICDECKLRIKKKVSIGKNQWKCEKCGLLNSLDTDICGACGGSMLGSGLWKCGKCALENKWKDQRCRSCNKKVCCLCKVNQISEYEGRCTDCIRRDREKWQCQFDHCKAWTDNNIVFCETCKVWRYSSNRRGAEIRILSDGREIKVWKCHKCHKFNNISLDVCECKETRYYYYYSYHSFR